LAPGSYIFYQKIYRQLNNIISISRIFHQQNLE